MSDPIPPDFEPPDFEPAAEPPPASEIDADPPTPKKPAWKSWVAAGVVTAAFAGGAIVAITIAGGDDGGATAEQASATEQFTGNNGATGPRTFMAGDRGARGTITAIDDETLTLDSTDPSGATSSVTVTTNDDTTFGETVEGTLADLAVGDSIVAMGTSSDDGVTAATIIDNGDEELGGGFRSGGPSPADGSGDGSGEATPRTFTEGSPGGPDGGMRGPDGDGGFTAGTIKSIEGSKITVETRDGSTVIVNTDADTTVSVNQTITRADLSVGDAVTVTGTTEDSTMTAESIQKGDLGFVRGAPPSSATD